jgi:chemotaxis response regulator CheB
LKESFILALDTNPKQSKSYKLTISEKLIIISVPAEEAEAIKSFLVQMPPWECAGILITQHMRELTVSFA